VSLKQDIERELKIPVRIRMGAPGSLNVFADGQQVYCYQQAKRKPVSGEVISTIKSLVGR
jgi:hypothetical protein